MNSPLSVQHAALLYFTDRLTQSLKAIAENTLTLVEAPMGYGKTVAVREYVRSRKARTVWVAVPDASTDAGAGSRTNTRAAQGENAFWRDFCRALGKAFPENADTVESLARVGYPRDAVLAGAACELLLQLDFGPETLLVVDDIHCLSDTEGGGMGALCALLVRHRVEHLHLVLISREGGRESGRESESESGCDSGQETRKGGQAFVAAQDTALIDRQTLALNAEDIRAYYALCGLPITEQGAAALHAATGGWISALYLCLLHCSEDGARVLPDPSVLFKTPASVDTLLEKALFSRLPEAVRHMLLILSPLECFTAEQAVFLLSEKGRQGDEGEPQAPFVVSEALASLVRHNSFITQDEESGVYTLHSLFRHSLQQGFAKLSPERRTAIHSRCADWFLLTQEMIPAMEACAAAQEYERALTVLESDMSRHFVTENPHFFVELFRACPEGALERHMGAAFKYAIAAFAAGDYAAFGAQLAWIGQKCAQRAARHGTDDPAARTWGGELEFLLSLAAYNDIAAMSAHHRRANALLGRPTHLFGPESPWTLGCPSVLFMFHRTSGMLDEELALMDKCLPHYYVLAAMHGAGGELQMRAEALCNRGDFGGAEVTCRKAQAMAWANGQLSVVLCCLFLRLRLALYDQQPEAAAARLKEMREQIRERRNFFLLHTVDLCEGYLHAFTGNQERAPQWLRAGVGGEKRLYTFAGGYYYVVHGRILLLTGAYAAVRSLFAWLLQCGAFAHHALFSVYAHVYTAVANTALGLEKEAEDSLRTALELALPDRLYLPFAEHVDALPQLRALSETQPDEEHGRQIMRLAWAMKGRGSEENRETRAGHAARDFCSDPRSWEKA